jgi:hypothetical protein
MMNPNSRDALKFALESLDLRFGKAGRRQRISVERWGKGEALFPFKARGGGPKLV